jgi:hypothetical protein
MITRFALVEWPAEYGSSGIMTFIVNQEGRVYQKDLGPKTSKVASSMEAYDPDSSWTLSPDSAVHAFQDVRSTYCFAGGR